MATTEKQAYLKRLQDQIEVWDEKVATLRAEATNVDSRMKVEYSRQLDLLTAKLEVLHETVQAFQKSGNAAWEDAKAVAEKALHEMKDAFDSAVSKLK